MRSVLRGSVTAVLLAAVGLPVWSGAQGVPELERRLDAHVAARDQAIALLAAYRGRVSPPRMFADTVVILDGTVVLVTDREFLPVTREAGALVEEFARRRAGAAASVLRGTVFAIWSDSIRRAEHGLVVSARVNDREVDPQYVVATPIALAQRLEMDVQERVGMASKPLYKAWLAAPLPLIPASNTEWRALRFELVSSPSSVAHRCYAGNLPACKVTLGLLEEADPATSWYDAATRRELVRIAFNEGILERRLSATCLSGRDTACVTLVRSSLALTQWLNPPGTGRARRTLAQLAFSIGPPGALARLARGSDLPSDALGAIAGVPVDSLISLWQRHAHDGGVESEIATPFVALGALGWILAMGALSLRSPRWR